MASNFYIGKLDGRGVIELQVDDDGNLQWRYVGDSEWNTLINLDPLWMSTVDTVYLEVSKDIDLQTSGLRDQYVITPVALVALGLHIECDSVGSRETGVK